MGGRDKFKGRAAVDPGIKGQAPGVTDIRVGGKPGRNEPCPCGSGIKLKKCHEAPPPPPSNEPPPCSVKDCEADVEYFLQPSVDGMSSPDQYWVACGEHREAIAAGAAQHGMDVHVVPFNTTEGTLLALGGLDPIDPPPETSTVPYNETEYRTYTDHLSTCDACADGEPTPPDEDYICPEGLRLKALWMGREPESTGGAE